jgi:hypothetical protein
MKENGKWVVFGVEIWVYTEGGYFFRFLLRKFDIPQYSLIFVKNTIK